MYIQMFSARRITAFLSNIRLFWQKFIESHDFSIYENLLELNMDFHFLEELFFDPPFFPAFLSTKIILNLLQTFKKFQFKQNFVRNLHSIIQ